MFLIETSDVCWNEKQYILDFFFKEALGLEYRMQKNNSLHDEVQISYNDNLLKVSQRLLTEDYFGNLKNGSIKVEIVDINESELGLRTYPTESKKVTSLFGRNYSNFPFDIFGSAFYLLARIEEFDKQQRDEHNRFPFGASILRNQELIYRPLVNEYVEVLWHNILLLAPGTERKNLTFAISPSHDIDNPFFYNNLYLLKKLKKLFKGPNKISLRDWFLNIQQKKEDPYCNIENIAKINSQAGIAGTFNFMASKASRYNSGYNIFDEKIISLIRAVISNDQNIGFHPGYESVNDIDIFGAEYKNLCKAVASINEDIKIKGGRQHFLRFNNPDTWKAWEKYKLEYDSTLGFAEEPGFRCGICFPYQVFDLEERITLSLVERPLILMDVSLTLEKYKNMNLGSAFQLANRLKQTTIYYKGNFEILFHNDWLAQSSQRMEFYKGLLN
jgi:hypothetical protein